MLLYSPYLEILLLILFQLNLTHLLLVYIFYSDSSNIESVIPREINTFDKETDINYSKYNDSIESYIKSQSLSGVSSGSEFTSYDQYKQKAELFERAIILNDLKSVLGNKLGGGIEHNIYNVNIF